MQAGHLLNRREKCVVFLRIGNKNPAGEGWVVTLRISSSQSQADCLAFTDFQQDGQIMGKVLILVLAAIFGLASPAHADEYPVLSHDTYSGDCLDGSKETVTIVRTKRTLQERDFFCDHVIVTVTKKPDTTEVLLIFYGMGVGAPIVDMLGTLDRKTNQMAIFRTSKSPASSQSSAGICLFSYARNKLSKIQCGSNSDMWANGTNTEIVVRFDVAQD